MTTIEKLKERGSVGLDMSPGDELCLQAAAELEALQKKLNHEMESNWTASLCDRVNELLREHPVFDEVKDGPACAKAITTIHGYCGSIKCERDSLRSQNRELRELLQALHDQCLVPDYAHDAVGTCKICRLLRKQALAQTEVKKCE